MKPKARFPLYFYFLSIGLFLLISCQSTIQYEQIPIPERRMNLSGLTAVSTRYLNEHPQDFHKFHRILTAADDALGNHQWITRAGVMQWLHRKMREEGYYDDQMPVYFFLRTVYLEGWERSYLRRADLSDREYLYDLISAVMGGMHLCTTCSTSHEAE